MSSARGASTIIVPSSVSEADPTVLARMDQLATLADPQRIVEALAGGLTNQNFKVTTPAGTFVARLTGRSSGYLDIDRVAEFHNSVAAHRAGVAPEVVEYSPAAGVLVIGWITGRTLTAEDLRNDALLPLVAAACRRLHQGPRFTADFDIFSLQRRYLGIMQQNNFRLPDRYTEFMSAVDRIRRVLSMTAVETVPCHNDLLAANFILQPSIGTDPALLWLIDYEYSGNNDPCFELGNLAAESDLSDDQLEYLVELYFGGPEPALTARARLLALVAHYGWTLWGLIQANVSPLDFDFTSWAMRKYERAVDGFDGPRLSTLLRQVADP